MRLAVMIAFLGCVAVPALAQPLAGCFRPSEIDDYQGLPGGRSIVVLDNQRQRFLLTFTTQCNNLGKYANLAFITRSPGRLACAERGDTVLSRAYGGPPDRCILKSVVPYAGEIASDGRVHK